MTIKRLLVANRGEIACRIFETTRRMGIEGVAVFSDADANARHVACADEAIRIGKAPAAESYLDSNAVLGAARACGADAIHPGYGFLSENADFAKACVDAGFIFVGPQAETIRAMAEKDGAKALMEAAGVAVIPGHAGSDQDPDALRAAGDELGYPLLIKAVAGGGGRGMRAVQAPEEFSAALEAAKREARGAFGDERMLLEKLLSPTRHLEVQIFGDAHGNVVHLYERDCSIQRRHQKVVEEAPAPSLPDGLRERLGEAAIKAAKAIGYRGAGTVEFLFDLGGDDAAFYFMEMNTRLQVEHPVTEMVTGIDLVEWQLRIADGEALPLAQDEIRLDGHSIEVRVCAEDPTADFLPTAGRIDYLNEPEADDSLRIETGVRQHDEVSVYYDSMLAKLVVWGEDRAVARKRLLDALSRYHLAGLSTNLSVLAKIVHHGDFEAGDFDNTFIDRHHDELLGPATVSESERLALAAVDAMLGRAQASAASARRSGRSRSPWLATDSWRPSGAECDELHFVSGGEEHTVTVEIENDERFAIQIAGSSHVGGGVSLDWQCVDQGRTTVHQFKADISGREFRATSVTHGSELTLFLDAETFRLASRDLAAGWFDDAASAGAVLTPMPGKIIEVMVAVGDLVENGQPMVVLEAMKMEHTVCANGDAVVDELKVEAGDQVDDGATLLVLSEVASATN